MINEHDKELALATLADKLEELAARVRATPPERFSMSDRRGVTEDLGPSLRHSLDGSAVATVTIEWPPGSIRTAQRVYPAIGTETTTETGMFWKNLRRRLARRIRREGRDQ